MRFQLEQQIHAPGESVVEAFADAEFYAALQGVPKLAPPEVLERRTSGNTVQLLVRYRFTGEVSSAVRAVVDPNRFTWVEEADHDLDARRVTFRLLPDHYADRFRCAGRYEFEAAGERDTRRNCFGDLEVRMPLVGRRVEKAIVSGLRDHLDLEADLVARWITDRGIG